MRFEESNVPLFLDNYFSSVNYLWFYDAGVVFRKMEIIILREF